LNSGTNSAKGGIIIRTDHVRRRLSNSRRLLRTCQLAPLYGTTPYSCHHHPFVAPPPPALHLVHVASDTKDKGKADDTTSVVSDNEKEGVLTSAIIVVKVKKDILIKIKDLTVFTRDKTKFSVYKTSVGLVVWADNKRIISNRNMKIVVE
jgi:hypothetical protein